MAERRTPPPTRRSLDDRIRDLALQDARHHDANVRSARLALSVASIVVARMLPSGAVRGGASMQIRFGAAARYTRDLDASRPADIGIDDYVDALADRLDEGWAGFGGTVAEEDLRAPEGIPDAYVMRPFIVTLAYRGSVWMNLPLELGIDEVGASDAVELVTPAHAERLFASIGLPDPGAVPILRAEHQVVQKLHACSSIGAHRTNDRARDLVDLQLLAEGIDLRATRTIALRLFRSRRQMSWPPTIIAHDGWSTLYEEAARGIDVLETVEEAVEWANALIRRIEDTA